MKPIGQTCTIYSSKRSIIGRDNQQNLTEGLKLINQYLSNELIDKKDKIKSIINCLFKNVANDFATEQNVELFRKVCVTRGQFSHIFSHLRHWVLVYLANMVNPNCYDKDGKINLETTKLTIHSLFDEEDQLIFCDEYFKTTFKIGKGFSFYPETSLRQLTDIDSSEIENKRSSYQGRLEPVSSCLASKFFVKGKPYLKGIYGIVYANGLLYNALEKGISKQKTNILIKRIEKLYTPSPDENTIQISSKLAYPEIVDVDLRYKKEIITDKNKLAKLCNYLASPSCITQSLNLNGIELNSQATAKLIAALEINKSITILKVVGCELSADALEEIGNRTNLNEIYLTDCTLRTKTKIDILSGKRLKFKHSKENILRTTKTGLLVTLANAILSSDLNNKQKIELLTKRIRQIPTSILSHRNFKALFSWLEARIELPNPCQSLKLDLNTINDQKKFIILLNYIIGLGCVSTFLDLGGLNLRGNVCNDLLMALENNTTITSLNITGCILGDIELSRIGELPSLKLLSMTDGLELKQQKEVLSVKVKGTSKLHTALSIGDRGLVASWTMAILSSELPSQQQLELLYAKNIKGFSGLIVGITYGHAEAIAIFSTLVLASELSDQQKVELLSAKTIDKDPGLYLALKNGHAKAVAALVKAILASSLSHEGKFELLSAKGVDGDPGLFIALENGHTEAVAVFVTAILASTLSNGEKFELLEAKTTDGLPGLLIALESGYVEVAAALVKAILASSLSHDKKFKLLSAENPDGDPGLFIALENGHTEVIIVVVEAILASSLSHQEKFGLLSAKTADGFPGLFIAMQDGHAEAVAALVKAILASTLSNQEKFELLAAKKADEDPGVFIALENGHTEVVAKFTTLILASTLSDQEKFELLAARAADGTYGLSIALQKDHIEAVIAFVSLILASTLSEQKKIELLNAQIAAGQSRIVRLLQNNYPKLASKFSLLISLQYTQG